MVEPNPNLINVRIAEIQKDHSWNELLTNLKIGGIFIPIIFFFLGFVFATDLKSLEWPSLIAISLSLFIILLILYCFVGPLIINKFTEIGKRNHVNNTRFFLLKSYILKGDKKIENSILFDNFPSPNEIQDENIKKHYQKMWERLSKRHKMVNK